MYAKITQKQMLEFQRNEAKTNSIFAAHQLYNELPELELEDQMILDFYTSEGRLELCM